MITEPVNARIDTLDEIVGMREVGIEIEETGGTEEIEGIEETGEIEGTEETGWTEAIEGTGEWPDAMLGAMMTIDLEGTETFLRVEMIEVVVVVVAVGAIVMSLQCSGRERRAPVPRQRRRSLLLI